MKADYDIRSVPRMWSIACIDAAEKEIPITYEFDCLQFMGVLPDTAVYRMRKENADDMDF